MTGTPIMTQNNITKRVRKNKKDKENNLSLSENLTDTPISLDDIYPKKDTIEDTDNIVKPVIDTDTNTNIDIDIDIDTDLTKKDKKDKKEKKEIKNLPGKYNKFMVFGFWLIENLHNNDIINDKNIAYEKLALLASLPDQIMFFKNYFEEFKSTQKLMKSTIRSHNKPKKVKTPKVVDPDYVPKKRGRKPKNATLPLPDKEEQLIADLVAAAQTSTQPQPVEKPKRKYNRKNKNTTEPEPEPVVEPEPEPESVVEPEPVEKPKRKYNRKNKNTTEPEPVVEPQPESPVHITVVESNPDTISTPHNDNIDIDISDIDNDNSDNDSEVELEVEPFSFDGKDYYIDANFNLYDTNTFLIIGRFIHNSIVSL
jgi:hypothetical protein